MIHAEILSRDDSSGERQVLNHNPSATDQSIDHYLDTHILKQVPTEGTFGFGLSLNPSIDNIRRTSGKEVHRLDMPIKINTQCLSH